MADNKEVLNIDRARECKFRESEFNHNYCGGTESCKLCPYMKKVIELWKSFCNTPAIEHGNYITEVWNNFPIGTNKAEIIDWFRQFYEVDIYLLEKLTGTLNGYYKEESHNVNR